MATEIKSQKDVLHWLAGRPVSDARAIASRATLRVLPLISGAAPLIAKRGFTFSELPSNIFRTTSLAWVSAKYPIHANELFRAARAAATAGGTAADTAASDVFRAARAAADSATGYAAAFSYLPADEAAAATVASAAQRAALRAADAVAGAAAAAAAASSEEQFWTGVREDVLALAEGRDSEPLANRPLWPGGIPHSISISWQTLVQLLPPNEDWDVWIAWYDRRLSGRAESERYELVFARVPDGEWKKGPAAANAWIKAELAKLEPPLASDHEVSELIKTIEGDPEGAAVEIVHGKAQLAESRNRDDFAVAVDPQTVQLHERVRKRALQARDKVARLANQRGFEAIADTVDEFARYISGDTRSVAANISVVWELSAAIGTFVERDDAARKGDGGMTQPMDAEPRESLDQVLTVAPAFIRRFPTAREHDRAVLESRRPRVSIETDKRVVEAARQNELLEQSLSKVLVIAASAAERSSDVQADKNRSWFGGTTRQIVVGFFGALVLGSFVTGALKEAGKEFWEHSHAGAAAGKFLLEKEADIIDLFKDLPADQRAALREIYRRLRQPRSEKPNADVPTEL